jgi:hypothetical protein
MRAGELLAHLPSLNAIYPQEGLTALIERKRTGHEREPMSAGDVAHHRPRIEALQARLEQEQQASPLPAETPVRPAIDALLRRLRAGR